MGYKTDITKQFKSKGMITGGILYSTEKKDNGAAYNLQEVIEKIASQGEEVEFTIKIKDSFDAIDTDEDSEQ